MITDNVEQRLWFDVGIKRYTTLKFLERTKPLLWFDVGIKRYTTPRLEKEKKL